MLIALLIYQNAEGADAKIVWAKEIYAGGTCTKGTCLGDVCTRSTYIEVIFIGVACVGGAFIRVAYISSIGTIKPPRIHLQLPQILQLGLIDMLLKLTTGIGAN